MVDDKEKLAIKRLRFASEVSFKLYKKPLIVMTSGGKDSSVCAALAQRAGIPFEVMHSHTTADAPETVYFVRDEFKRLEGLGIKCMIEHPIYKGKRTSMWSLIPQKLMPPTRCARYCCDVLKERSGRSRYIVTGVRASESKKRSGRGAQEVLASDPAKRIILNNDNDEKRLEFETCMKRNKRVCNPIIDWTDRDVWDYLDSEHIPVNQLYQCGFSRVGCIGCPMAGRKGRQRGFALYPKFQSAYIWAFERMTEERRKKGLALTWRSGEEVYHWWMEDGVMPGQIGFDDLDDSEEGT